ncbi:hypothetical protein ES702_06050 [subsurface metagenome]
MSTRAIFLIFLMVSLKSICFAHGIIHKQIEGGIGIEVTYDDGTPMSYSETRIYSPSDGETEFQHGFTDRNGRFVFSPDVEGKWKIIVNDGMGHGVVTNISVGETMEIEKRDVLHFSRWQKAVIGVSLIWGIIGTLFHLLTKGEEKNTHS